MFDSNDVTLDAMASATQSEDFRKRYEAYGFETQLVKEGNNIEAVLHAYEAAVNSKSGKPQFIEIKTLIAKAIPEVAGTNKVRFHPLQIKSDTSARDTVRVVRNSLTQLARHWGSLRRNTTYHKRHVTILPLTARSCTRSTRRGKPHTMRGARLIPTKPT